MSVGVLREIVMAIILVPMVKSVILRSRLWNVSFLLCQTFGVHLVNYVEDFSRVYYDFGSYNRKIPLLGFQVLLVGASTSNYQQRRLSIKF